MVHVGGLCGLASHFQGEIGLRWLFGLYRCWILDGYWSVGNLGLGVLVGFFFFFCSECIARLYTLLILEGWSVSASPNGVFFFLAVFAFSRVSHAGWGGNPQSHNKSVVSSYRTPRFVSCVSP